MDLSDSAKLGLNKSRAGRGFEDELHVTCKSIYTSGINIPYSVSSVDITLAPSRPSDDIEKMMIKSNFPGTLISCVPRQSASGTYPLF